MVFLIPAGEGIAQPLKGPLASNVTATPDSLNFGQVVISKSRTLTFVLQNTGTSSIQVTTFGVSNPIEFNVVGATNYSLQPGSTQAYTVTFAPQATQNVHTGLARFTFGDLSTETVYFIGYDHPPTASIDTLAVRKDYLAYSGSTVTISQELRSDLQDSIYNFTENILYDPTVLDFIGANNGAITLAPDWSIRSTLGTPGNAAIRAGSVGYALKGPGELLQLVFHVRNECQVYATSPIWDSAAIFGLGVAKFFCDSGSIHIVGQCTPIMGPSGFKTHIFDAVPNPANDRTTITYSVRRNENGEVPQVYLRIFNAVGEPIRTIHESPETEGTYNVEIKTGGLSPGVYYYEFEADAVHTIRRLFVLH